MEKQLFVDIWQICIHSWQAIKKNLKHFFSSEINFYAFTLLQVFTGIYFSTFKDFEMRCPQGKKTKLYKKGKLEKFAHYLMRDGLISRLSIYEDRELTDLVTVREFFAHRQDKLQQRMHNHRTGWITEYFGMGRQRSLKGR